MALTTEHIENNQEFNTQENIVGYASLLHNKWRETRKEVGGTAKDGLPLREERKKLSDPDNQESEQIDIANLPFEDLPPAWQKENLLAAEKAMNDIQALSNNGVNSVVDLEEVSAKTHVTWKGRNPWAEGEQAGPYGEMSIAEKNKDREILLGAIGYLAEQGYTIRAVNTGYMHNEKLEQELAENRTRLADEEIDPEVREELEARQKEVRASIHMLKQGEFLDRAHTIHRYKPKEPKKGTEGALKEVIYNDERGQDRYGLRDGESTDDKRYRNKIEGLLRKGDPSSRAEAHKLANMRIEEIDKQLTEIGENPKTTAGYHKARLLNKVKGYLQELANESSED